MFYLYYAFMVNMIFNFLYVYLGNHSNKTPLILILFEYLVTSGLYIKHDILFRAINV